MAIMTSREALIKLLHYEGVEYIFGLPGFTEVLFMDSLEDHPEIKYILGLHETVAMGMAEGYARTADKVGVVNLHTDTGLSATFPMLRNAYAGGVPLLVTAGQQDTRILMQGPHLTGDLVGMVSQFTKWSTEILHAEDIPRVIRRAFKEAMHPPTGPVFVSLPQNILNENIDFEASPNTPPFGKLRPDREAINRAVEFLKLAKNPAIITDSGVARNDALAELVRFAELVGAKVYQTWMSDVNFPVNHPQYLGIININTIETKKTLQSVDVLLIIGAHFFSPLMYLTESIINNETKVIHIDDNPKEIGKNYPVASGIQGNIKIALTEICDILKEEMPKDAQSEARVRTKNIAAEKEGLSKAFLNKADQEKNNVPISPSRLMQELKNIIKPGTLVVDDCWTCSATLQQMLGFNEPKSFQRAREGGSIGWGMPGALGVKLAAPDKPVIAVCGDGSSMWSIQSLWTAAHYNIPVKYVICANAEYGQVKISKMLVMGDKAKERFLGMEFEQPRIDFCRIAEAMGIRGHKVKRPNEIADTLKSAFESDKPELIEVYLAKAF